MNQGSYSYASRDDGQGSYKVQFSYNVDLVLLLFRAAKYCWQHTLKRNRVPN